ncbi:hypothetical protein HaLaN_22918, partial [Haematococcus lacustris]
MPCSMLSRLKHISQR